MERLNHSRSGDERWFVAVSFLSSSWGPGPLSRRRARHSSERPRFIRFDCLSPRRSYPRPRAGKRRQPRFADERRLRRGCSRFAIFRSTRERSASPASLIASILLLDLFTARAPGSRSTQQTGFPAPDREHHEVLGILVFPIAWRPRRALCRDPRRLPLALARPFHTRGERARVLRVDGHVGPPLDLVQLGILGDGPSAALDRVPADGRPIQLRRLARELRAPRRAARRRSGKAPGDGRSGARPAS